MEPIVFISHRAEYATQVRALKNAIQDCSNAKVRVFISEDIPHSEEWRKKIESQLRETSSLLLVYGTPEEDWSWCFYEAGFFAGLPVGEDSKRGIYCIIRPNVPIPGPLGHLQAVKGPDELIDAVQEIYRASGVDCDTGELRDATQKVCRQLYSRLEKYRGHPRVYLTIKEADLDNLTAIPPTATLCGDPLILGLYFGLNKQSAEWREIVEGDGDLDEVDRVFFLKWLHETQDSILKARKGRIQVAQTVLIARGGANRCRFLLDEARIQPDGDYVCEFLVLNEVGGRPGGLSKQELAVLTSIRMGLRFRYELIEAFRNLPMEGLPPAERRKRIEDIRDIMDNLTTEADTRGFFAPGDFFGAFEGAEKERLQQLIGKWPTIEQAINESLGISDKGKIISKDGLTGPNIKKFQSALEGLRLMNLEFLSRCCQWASRRNLVNEDELRANGQQLDMIVAQLRNSSHDPLPQAAE